MKEWISVKERFPEEKEGKFPSELVLIYCTINGVRVGYFHKGKMHIQCGNCSEKMNITHWMAAQEPPK